MTAPPWLPGFERLFKGRTDAVGLGRGGVQRRQLHSDDYRRHLAGEVAIGVFPMRPDNRVWFAAVDLDRPDFDLARAVAGLLPGTAYLERSRSGNAHVWVFFDSPVEAWIPRGVMRAALEVYGEPHVEVFPKQDALPPVLPGEPTPLGNYINLPYYGDTRPIVWTTDNDDDELFPFDAGSFVVDALEHLQSPASWRLRAEFLGIVPPAARTPSAREFGSSETLHVCAEYILEGARSGQRPIREGGRSIVFFNLAKQLLMWERLDQDDAWELLVEINEAAEPPLPKAELRRVFGNAASGRWTSTGCDDPNFLPYASPACPIANPPS